MKPTILVVDDEPSILDVLTYNLEKAHFRVEVARDGEEALRHAKRLQPDLIVLDLMLPGMDGFEVCRELRKEGDVPIIMLTARDEEIDRVVGLELGADDYVVKPFSMRELMARIKSVLRRASQDPLPAQEAVSGAGFRLSPDRHEIHWRGTEIQLTPLEFDLLDMFLRHPGQVLKREQLLSEVWGYDFHGDTRSVDSAIKRLRAKLHRLDPRAAESLRTVRGVGYKLVDEETESEDE
jgi:two-component system alkaline phosphatase synthesis response regulator PhoP